MTVKTTAYAIEQEVFKMKNQKEDYGFKIVVHSPANTEELEKRVAQAHAEAIFARMKRLQCTAEQKRRLIDEICEACK